MDPTIEVILTNIQEDLKEIKETMKEYMVRTDERILKTAEKLEEQIAKVDDKTNQVIKDESNTRGRLKIFIMVVSAAGVLGSGGYAAAQAAGLF